MPTDAAAPKLPLPEVRTAVARLTEAAREGTLIEPYAGAADDLKLVLKAARLQDQFAVTISYYNAIRIATLPPSLERSAAWERNRHRPNMTAEDWERDLGWLWSALLGVSDYYAVRQDKAWKELTPKEQDMASSISFIHNWIKLLGLQKWSSEDVAEQVLAEARATARRELLEELLAELPAPASIVEPAWLEEKLAAEPPIVPPAGVPAKKL